MQRFDVAVKRASTGRPNGVGKDVEQRLGADGTVRGELRRTPTRTAVHIEVQSGRRRAAVVGGIRRLRRRPAGVARAGSRKDVATAVNALQRAGARAGPRRRSYAAYDAYQRGRALLEQRNRTVADAQPRILPAGGQTGSGYAAPWAGMADVYIAQGVAAFGPLVPLESRRLAKDAATHALELDPNLAEAHTSLAFAAFFHDWDWDGAEMRFRKAIGLNDQYALAHHWYADYLNAMGRQKEAMVEIGRAHALEPLSILIDRDIGWHLFFQQKVRRGDRSARADAASGTRRIRRRAHCWRARSPNAADTPTRSTHLRLAAPAMAKTRGVNLSFVAYVQAKSGDTPRG